jgi:hypothetical protein
MICQMLSPDMDMASTLIKHGHDINFGKQQKLYL